MVNGQVHQPWPEKSIVIRGSELSEMEVWVKPPRWQRCLLRMGNGQWMKEMMRPVATAGTLILFSCGSPKEEGSPESWSNCFQKCVWRSKSKQLKEWPMLDTVIYHPVSLSEGLVDRDAGSVPWRKSSAVSPSGIAHGHFLSGVANIQQIIHVGI